MARTYRGFGKPTRRVVLQWSDYIKPYSIPEVYDTRAIDVEIIPPSGTRPKVGLKGSTLSCCEIILPNNATLYICADGMASKGMVTLPEVIHSANNIFVAMLDEIIHNQIEYSLDSDERVCLFDVTDSSAYIHCVLLPVLFYYIDLNFQVEKQGRTGSMKHHKKVVAYTRKWAFESITKDNQTLDGVDLDIDGFPTKLVGVVKGYIRRRSKSSRLAMILAFYLLNISRHANSCSRDDGFIDDIVDESINRDTVIGMFGCFSGFAEYCKIQVRYLDSTLQDFEARSLYLDDFTSFPDIPSATPIYSTKAGPNSRICAGMNATKSAIVDSYALTTEERNLGIAGEKYSVLANITQFSDYIGITPSYSEYIRELSKQCVPGHFIDLSKYTYSDICTGRIAVLDNQENKARIVAIGDWFSQSLLRPIHDHIHGFTKRCIPWSYVDNQQAGIDKVKEYTKLGASKNMPMSWDASAMTDRFSVIPQDTVVGILLNDRELGRLWNRLVSYRNFRLPPGLFSNKPNHSNVDEVRYVQGQGMGLYTSFPAMNVTHILLCGYAHMLAMLGYGPMELDRVSNGDFILRGEIEQRVRLEWRENAFKRFNPFGWMKAVAFLGDDVWHKHSNTAYWNYITLMNITGVKFNNLKSQITTDPSFKVAEFCKRVMVNGVNVTPVSPIVMKLLGANENMLALISDEDISLIKGWIRLVFRNIDSKPIDQHKKDISKSLWFVNILSVLIGRRRMDVVEELITSFDWLMLSRLRELVYLINTKTGADINDLQLIGFIIIQWTLANMSTVPFQLRGMIREFITPLLEGQTNEIVTRRTDMEYVSHTELASWDNYVSDEDRGSTLWKDLFNREKIRYSYELFYEITNPITTDSPSIDDFLEGNHHILGRQNPTLCFGNLRLMYDRPEIRLCAIYDLCQKVMVSKSTGEFISQHNLGDKQLSTRYVDQYANGLINDPSDGKLLPPEIIAWDEALRVYSESVTDLSNTSQVYGLSLEEMSEDGFTLLQIYLSEVLHDASLSTRRGVARNYVGDPRRFNPILDEAFIKRASKVSKSVLHWFGIIGHMSNEYFAAILDRSSRITTSGDLFIQFRTWVSTPKGEEDIVSIIDLNLKDVNSDINTFKSDIELQPLPTSLLVVDNKDSKQDNKSPPN